MTMTAASTEPPTGSPAGRPVQENVRWYALSGDDTVARLGVEAASGLSAAEVTSRLATYGKNEVATEPPPTTWQIARGQIANPMNIMLLIVSIASFTIGQIATGTIVLALVTFNVIMGTNQERKAMASVEALAQLQVPTARVRRDRARSRRSTPSASCRATSCWSKRATSCPPTLASSPPRRSRSRRRR